MAKESLEPGVLNNRAGCVVSRAPASVPDIELWEGPGVVSDIVQVRETWLDERGEIRG